MRVQSRLCLCVFVFALYWSDCQCFLGSPLRRAEPSTGSQSTGLAPLQMNLLTDMLGGGSKLESQESLPYAPEFCSSTSCVNDVRTFAVQERLISFVSRDTILLGPTLPMDLPLFESEEP
jgi:hypothetical protein